MSAYGEEQIGRVLGGRYRLVAAVGTGASATVYQADDVQLRRRVAVKVLHPSLAEDAAFLRRFQGEAQAAAALSHPNIMAVFDWGTDRRVPYLVLEYLGGGSLRAMLDRGRLLSPSQSLLVGLEASRGLDYAHRRGFVHRDIKPANLLFGEDRRLRIADFGLARAIADAAWTEPSGVVLGTARYASPEQAKGEAVDGKSDVYSLALTLVESVTGDVPFAGETTVATLMNRLDRLMPVSAELGPLAAVIERAGRPDPTERSSAADLGQGLIAAAEKLPRPAPLALVATSVRSSMGDTTTIAGPARERAAGSGQREPHQGDHTEPAGRTGRTMVADEPPPSGELAAPAAMPPVPPESSLSSSSLSSLSGRPPELFDQDASRPRRTRNGFLITVAVLAVAAAIGVAALVVRRSNPASYPVEGLVGLEIGEARNRIATYGWEVEEIREKNDDQPLDVVIRTDPASGDLEEGQPFTLYVSDGPTPSELPPLAGQRIEVAMLALSELDLKLTVAGQEPSETVPAGTILSFTVAGQQVPERSMVDKGSTVNAVVSSGPAPRTIPAIAGMAPADADAALKGLGLVPVRGEDVFADGVPAGRVATSTPAPGTAVPRGSTITYQVSKGPNLVKVPVLNMMNLQQATAALAAAGLTVGPVTGDPNRAVVIASPPAGTSVPRGTAVALTFF
jgi:serine/threonine-protein kinase